MKSAKQKTQQCLQEHTPLETATSSHSGWEALYDFLNEIFATMIPGAFFLSFFFALYFILAPDTIISRINSFSSNMYLISTVVIGAIAYCFGALFQRKEIKKVDAKSAKYIFRKKAHDSGHSFAFSNALTDLYFDYVLSMLQTVLIHHLSIHNQSLLTSFIEKAKVRLGKDISTQILLDSNIRRVFQNNKLSQNFLTVNENRNPNYLNDTLIDCIVSYYFQLLNLPIVSGTAPALNSIDSQLRKTGSMPLTKLVEQSLSSYTISFYTELAKTHEFIFEEQMEHSWFKMLYKSVYTLGEFRKERNRTLNRHKNTNYYKLRRISIMLNKILRNEHLPDEQKRQLSMIHAFVFSDVDGSIDWPYTHMYAYCLDRGLSFSDYVDWGDGANRKRCVLDKLKHPQQLTYQDELNRSKSRLNTLKMEIGKADEYYFRIITKTEAHIRFINSLWYAMQILAKIIPVVWGLLVIYCFYAYTHLPSLPEIDTYMSWLLSEAQFPVLMVGLVCVIYALICWYIRHSTLEIMHYQRVRELTMILEAQYLCGSRKQ